MAAPAPAIATADVKGGVVRPAVASPMSPTAAASAGAGVAPPVSPPNKVDGWIERLMKGQPLLEPEIKLLCELVKAMLMEESNVQPVNSPVTIVGDIHGQLFDLIFLFEKVNGKVPEQKYLFLGDYVDRGPWSIEVISLLMCLKARWPDHVTLLRGNHESREISQTYGFFAECLNKYGSSSVWKYVVDMFDYMPIAALIDNEIFCVHGGLSPSVTTIDQIRLIERNQELPRKGPLSDLMWSDPEDMSDTWAISDRGGGFYFGAKVVDHWNHINNTTLVARSHQLAAAGYKYHFPDKTCITVWSAPNYCGTCGNVASVMRINKNMDREIRLFKEAPGKDMSKYNKPTVDYFL